MADDEDVQVSDHEGDVDSSGVSRHVCEVCGKTYARRNHLLRHKRAHDRTYRYQCDCCSKKFYRRDQMMVHQKSCFNRAVRQRSKRKTSDAVPESSGPWVSRYLIDAQKKALANITVDPNLLQCRLCSQHFDHFVDLIHHEFGHLVQVAGPDPAALRASGLNGSSSRSGSGTNPNSATLILEEGADPSASAGGRGVAPGGPLAKTRHISNTGGSTPGPGTVDLNANMLPLSGMKAPNGMNSGPSVGPNTGAVTSEALAGVASVDAAHPQSAQFLNYSNGPSGTASNAALMSQILAADSSLRTQSPQTTASMATMSNFGVPPTRPGYMTNGSDLSQPNLTAQQQSYNALLQASQQMYPGNNSINGLGPSFMFNPSMMAPYGAAYSAIYNQQHQSAGLPFPGAMSFPSGSSAMEDKGSMQMRMQ